MVTGRNAGHAGTDRLDDPRALVAAHERKADMAAALSADVLIGVTEPRRLIADQHLELLGLVEIEFGDFPVGSGLVQHGRPRGHGRHRLSLLIWVSWAASRNEAHAQRDTAPSRDTPECSKHPPHAYVHSQVRWRPGKSRYAWLGQLRQHLGADQAQVVEVVDVEDVQVDRLAAVVRQPLERRD